MNHKQHDCRVATQPGCADREPPLLSAFVHSVESDKAVVIFKDKCGQFKGDAVLLLIEPVFLLASFVAHMYIQE